MIEGLQNMTLQADMESKAYVTGCLLCGKPYDQVIEQTFANYLHQIAEKWESVKDRVLNRNAFIHGLQSVVFTFVPRGMSQDAACGARVYALNCDNPQPVT